MAVRIRLKKMGRTHRPFYRVCAFDSKSPRDGRALEELGTYDTSVRNTDARAILNHERIDHWLSVGAQPTEKVAVLIKKYGSNGTHLEQQKAALEELAAPKSIPDPGAPAATPKKQEDDNKPAEGSAETADAAEEASADANEASEATEGAATAADTEASSADTTAEGETPKAE